MSVRVCFRVCVCVFVCVFARARLCELEQPWPVALGRRRQRDERRERPPVALSARRRGKWDRGLVGSAVAGSGLSGIGESLPTALSVHRCSDGGNELQRPRADADGEQKESAGLGANRDLSGIDRL